MNPSQIEILLATYQGEKYIDAQLQSLLNQTYPHFHIVVRDDASIDDTVSKVLRFQHQFPEKFSLLSASSNEGLIANFSALLEHSTAPYLMLCDQDDVWHPEKIQKTLDQMVNLEQTHGSECPLLVHTDLTVVDAELQEIHPSFWQYSRLSPQRGNTLNRLLMQNSITGCTVMINRALLKKALPIPATCVMHDWWLALTAATFGQIGIVDEPLIRYRQHTHNDTGAKPYGLRTYLRRWFSKDQKKKMERSYHRRFEQANAFLERHSSILTKEQKVLIDRFLAIRLASKSQRLFLMAKHQLYKQGFWRNVAELWI